MIFSRRTFFGIAAGGALALNKMSAQAPVKKRADMISLSARPQDLEMPLAGFADYITPLESLFVRTHVYVPTVDLASWRLKIDGEVDRPATLTMDQIRRMPPVEMIAVIECAGNGRSLFTPHVPGLQWSTGGVGNIRWKGVRLADVLKRAGIRSNAAEILFNGADLPLGKMQDFRRSITARKALDENTLLAYEANGQPLPQQHGFPLRVVAPGWASDSWVKWVTDITVLDKEFDGFWMKSAYRKPDFPVEPGATVPNEKMVPVTTLSVKSVVYSLTPTLVRGVSWSGDHGPISAVDISEDNAATWKAATFEPRQETQFGWRHWSYKPSSRNYVLTVRARDAAGNMQQPAPQWNPSGYGWNVYTRVSSSPECTTCHGMDVIREQHLTRAQWDREITKMTNWGADVKPEDREKLLDFLSNNFK